MGQEMTTPPSSRANATLKSVAATFVTAAGLIGGEGLELLLNLLALLLVERSYGAGGLGIFSYLAATFFVTRYFSSLGIPRFIELKIAEETDPGQSTCLIGQGLWSILCLSLGSALLLLATAKLNQQSTQVHEPLVVYFLLAVTLPFANCNSLKLAILSGRGKFGLALRQRLTRLLVILLAIYFLATLTIPPPGLVIAYLAGELFTALRLRKVFRFPSLKEILKQPKNITATLRDGSRHLFSDHGMDLLVNIDFFILGIFVAEWQLGIYAEAAIMARCCLIVPLALRPVFRRYYLQRTRQSGVGALLPELARHSAGFFTLQALFALLTLLFYPVALNVLFDIGRELNASFEIFLILMPGLLFFSTFSVMEPAFEALNEPLSLKRMTVWITLINLFLTATLVPVAGITGSAIATTVTMLIHVILFLQLFPYSFTPRLNTFAAGAVGLYLTYLFFHHLVKNGFVSLALAPVVLVGLLYACGLYGVEAKNSQSPRDAA